MRGPVEVRVQTTERDEILGDQCRALSFRKTAPGGYAGGTLTLAGRWQHWSLGPGARVFAYDARDGDTLWEGYLDNPGQTYDIDGETFDIGAQGAQTVVGDRSEVMPYLDATFDHWRPDDRNNERLAPSAQADNSAFPDTERDAIMLQFASGTPIAKRSEARAIYDLFDASPMGIGAYGFTVRSGIASNRFRVLISSSTVGTIEALDMLTSSQFARGVIGDNMASAADVLKLRLRRTGGATNIGTDRIWTGFAAPVVAGRRLNLRGRDQLGSGSDIRAIRSHEVVRDMVYRLMPSIDNELCVIETGSYDIDQLCYADPVRATGIFDDLELFEPDMMWLVGASDDLTSKHRFTYKAWPDTPRYEISVADGYDAPGGEADLCNEITVGWVDAKGNERSTKVTADVPELGNRVRAAEKVTLDESVSSQRNANQIGRQVLRMKNNPPKAATATVNRPVWDITAGRFIPAWRMEPGEQVLVREVNDTLRLTELEFSSTDYGTSLTLGEPAPTQEQLIARLAKTTRRKR